MDTRYREPLSLSVCRRRLASKTWQSQNSRPDLSQASSMKEIVPNPPIALATSRTTFPWPPAPHNTKSLISPRLGRPSQELRHRGMARLADTLSPKHLQHRQPQNPGVQPQAPMIDIPHVQLKLLFPRKA